MICLYSLLTEPALTPSPPPSVFKHLRCAKSKVTQDFFVSPAHYFSFFLSFTPSPFSRPHPPSLLSRNQTSHRSQSCCVGGKCIFSNPWAINVHHHAAFCSHGIGQVSGFILESRGGGGGAGLSSPVRIQGQFIITARVRQGTKKGGWRVGLVVSCRTAAQ